MKNLLKKFGMGLLTFAASGGAAFAQVTGTTTPGVPTTGLAGNAAANIVLLVLAALLIIGGIAYMMQSPRGNR